MDDVNRTLCAMELNENWKFRQVGKSDWYPSEVPGCVQTDLLNNKMIDDPFYRNNEQNVQWIDKENWDYKLEFDLNSDFFSKNHIELLCEGLDTYATVYLNEEKIEIDHAITKYFGLPLPDITIFLLPKDIKTLKSDAIIKNKFDVDIKLRTKALDVYTKMCTGMKQSYTKINHVSFPKENEYTDYFDQINKEYDQIKELVLTA